MGRETFGLLLLDEILRDTRFDPADWILFGGQYHFLLCAIWWKLHYSIAVELYEASQLFHFLYCHRAASCTLLCEISDVSSIDAEFERTMSSLHFK